MTKPQTLAEQIRAMEPQAVDSPVNPREAWEAARNQAAALADAATPTGWVIANGNNNRWRCVWEWESNAEWTDDVTQALKFATRDDAERYSKEDEDAWLIYQVGIPTTTTPVVGAEHACGVRQAEGPQHRALKTCLGCCHFKSEYWREPSGDGETYDSGTSADCLKAGRSICSYFGDEPTPPDWCPCAALATTAILALPGPTDAQLRDEAVKLAEWQAMREALEWYGEQARLCRLTDSEGDAAINTLARDGGKMAEAALAAMTAWRDAQ